MIFSPVKLITLSDWKQRARPEEGGKAEEERRGNEEADVRGGGRDKKS